MAFLRFLGRASFLAAVPTFGVSQDSPPPIDVVPASKIVAPGDLPTDSVLPQKIPGYELRVLDFHKPVLLTVGTEKIEASLPVFFYMPASDRIHAATAVRHVYDDLQTLGHKEQWSRGEFQNVIIGLEKALRLLEVEPKTPPEKT